MEEVLPCSDTQSAAESDRSQLNLGTSYLYLEEPINCVENREDDMFEYGNQLNDSLLKKTEGRGPTVSEILANSYCQNAGALVFDSQVKNQEKPCSLHAIEDDDINEPRLTSENSLSMVDLIENESPNTGREGALSFSEPAWLKGKEETMAVWVKWRGTWLAGIKCVRADCPLSTLKVKPTDEQKNYFVIFFPHTKNHIWADMLLVRPIDDFPQPTAYKTHQEGLEMVKDLTVARRFIMQDIAVSILNTLDKLHSQALVETACDVMVWKELAMEASRCNAYSDLGRMLLKLQNSIAPRYISADWVNSSFDSWAERCWNLNSAESVELLKEELFDSILWSDVNSLRVVPVQETLGSEWKTWKQDVMKWFSMPDSASQVSLQIGSKRCKLQVRRADTHTSLVGIKGSDQSITLETNPGFSKNQNTVSALAIVTSVPENFREAHVETDLPSNLTNQRNEIVVEGTDSEILNSNGMELTPIDEMAGEKIMEPGTKNQQCIAYVEAKGRQCVRSANHGDKYCGVHSWWLSSSRKTKKPVLIETPMCAGITYAGARCKHHSLPDSPFCNKHQQSADTRRKLKRKHEGSCTRSKRMICKDMVLLNDESPLQVIPVSDHSITLETNPGFSKNQDTVSALAIVTSEQESFREVHVETDLPCNLTDQRNEIVVEGTDSEILNSNGMELIPIEDMAGEKIMEPGTKNKQCIAYVEAKGRLCVRPPNDSDKYCCVHSRCLSSLGITKKCVGITIAGARCKHHSLPDSPFCKKHRPSAETNRKLKRKHEGNCTPSEGLICKDMVLLNDEVPLQVIPMSANHDDCFLHKFPGKLVLSGNSHNALEEAPRCLGSPPYDNEDPCLQSPLWYFLYCEKHLPSWLKRGRYGKSRVISKEVFTEILRDCSSWEQKVHLHTACGFFHRLFNGILSNPVSKEFQIQWTMTEAAKDPSVGELLKRLIMSEKERIKLVWGLDDDIDISSLMEGPSLIPSAINGRHDNGEFLDDRTQGNHWMDNHKKEAPWLCSSYGCAICQVSFTEKKLLENHVQERHQGAKCSDHSITLATIPGFSKNQDTVTALEIVTPEWENLREVPVETDIPSKNQQWNSNGMESTSIEAGTMNQQCVAYDEVKGRQSVRSALRSARKAKKPVPIKTPMCGGTTYAGSSCKHHSLPDSLFCKKHLPGAETRCKLKGQHEASCTGSEGLICKDTGPLQVDPVLAIHGGCFLDKLPRNLALFDNDHNATKEALRCLGAPPYDNEEPCLESPLWHFLYCEKHFPNWLKHSRIGKRRIISKEVFTEILRDCSSWEQKVHLHKACAFFYTLFKGILRNPELKELQFQCTMTEATKDPCVAELLKRLIISEKDRIKLIWGFNDDIDISSLMEGPWILSTAINDSLDHENCNKCNICNAEFIDDRTLGNHWIENHEKEAQGLLRGFACAICLHSFTEKKLLENHVQGRHRMQFVEQCLLLQCITCGSHFRNMELLWFHVLSVHPVEFKLQLVAPEQETLTLPPCEASPEILELGNSTSLDNDSQDPGSLMKFRCSFCELKLNLLPDLGRHHKTAHMGRYKISSKLAKRKALCSAHRLKSGRLSRPKFKKGSSAASYRTRSRANANLKRHIQETKSRRMKGTAVHLNSGSLQNGIVLCDDISFGKESIPVICVEDQETLNSQFQPPWESFTYVTKPRLYQSLSLHSESMRMRCYCSFSTFYPETCDHAYLFDNEFDDAKDVFGKPMRGRSPYDENGHIILEEGYLVYECNNMCRCNKTCRNRILQNGIRVKLEVFKTEKKGWGVRAGEAILRGTFICELLGEVLDEREAHDRRKRYGKEHSSYFYDIDARFNDTSKMSEGQGKYVIDATRYGNVSRFINNSCSPNLVSYQVLVESMDCKRSHIGLYASRDIALGEELTFDYQCKLVAGEETPCLCGSSNCRGRLY